MEDTLAKMIKETNHSKHSSKLIMQELKELQRLVDKYKDEAGSSRRSFSCHNGVSGSPSSMMGSKQTLNV